ncbi:granzyme A-like [Tiliqua scincoides]|uniref:granzyme A-like n=1 Tax=Tiliqua scincoides TaxID=71010 RepID=UPI0034618410
MVRLSFAMCFSMAIVLLRITRGQCADIIGGSKSRPHSRPFMALIFGTQLCGGTLVKPNWVLTAAHCQLGRKPSIVLGAHSKSEQESTKQNFSIMKQFPHPGFSSETTENDLMLLQLNKPAKITPAVKPLTLPRTYKDVKAGTKCLVAGWGITANGQKKPSDTLREVNVSVINRRICNDRKHYNSHPPVTMNMVCAGDKKGRKASCLGDSGGPLICKGEQRGIVSFGRKNKCGDPKYPDVYTRLTKEYLSWITRTMNSNY